VLTVPVEIRDIQQSVTGYGTIDSRLRSPSLWSCK